MDKSSPLPTEREENRAEEIDEVERDFIMLPRTLTTWPRGQLNGIVIVLVVVTCIYVCV